MEKITDAIYRLENHFYDDRLAELYGKNLISIQRERYIKLLNWQHSFFNVDNAIIFSSP
ncbi:MAG: hypothetical protein JEY91_13785, partial [Spirochaetaceae bacterium]|nr:hypothetical protein [Spirochaetaceae bacterium]